MKEYPVTLEGVTTVEEIHKALDFGFRRFPVINKSGQLVGSISANFLIVLIKNKCWYSKTLSRVFDHSGFNYDETDE
jgi:hypothetical protein